MRHATTSSQKDGITSTSLSCTLLLRRHGSHVSSGGTRFCKQAGSVCSLSMQLKSDVTVTNVPQSEHKSSFCRRPKLLGTCSERLELPLAVRAWKSICRVFKV